MVNTNPAKKSKIATIVAIALLILSFFFLFIYACTSWPVTAHTYLLTFICFAAKLATKFELAKEKEEKVISIVSLQRDAVGFYWRNQWFPMEKPMVSAGETVLATYS